MAVGSVWLTPGTLVQANGAPHAITKVLDLEHVLARDSHGKPVRLLIRELAPFDTSTLPAADKPATTDLADVPDRDWRSAQRRFDAIRPLLEAGPRTKAEAAARAAEIGVDVATLYRWIRRFQRTGTVLGLVRARPGFARGRGFLPEQLETLIGSVLEDTYLRDERPSMQKACNEVLRRCKAAGVKPPHPNTVRLRIARLPEQATIQRRFGRRAAREQFEPIKGHFPGADWPLAYIQIDHTKVDLMLVDDLHRRPVGRPWITLAIDVFSRMVAGFYISFDPPGALAAGLCIAHAILPKDGWLVAHGITTAWPLWGVMGTVHMDNAMEFRGNTVQRACENYGIAVEWRPVATPNYGAHIERLLGTFNRELHALPGTTFSNVREKGDYDSEGKAFMSLGELERWLANYIVNIYHQRVHSVLGTTPLKRYEEGILGTSTLPARGLPPRITDERRLRLDFMPYVERSVQPYGIVIDEVHYYSDVLRPWINSKDPDDPKRKRQFVVRRDPRDISVIFFYDPETREYYEIPYRDTSRPAISVWELREARRRLEAEGQANVDENLLFKSFERLREIEQAARKETTTVRRKNQRRRLHQGALRATAGEAPPPPTAPAGADLGDIRPFEELDDLVR